MTASPTKKNVFDYPAPRLFSIDAGRPFLTDLANGLMASIGTDQETIARTIVFLPTRRAARALGENLLRAIAKQGMHASLLPRIRAIGDIDDDELDAFSGAVEDELDIPPAISATERLLALARLVAVREKAFSGRENWVAAISVANELSRLLDSFYSEEVSFEALARIDVGDHARHWAQSLHFLEIITQAWPSFLEEIGRSDPTSRRVMLIRAQAAMWERNPPDHPVIIAGSTASAPSTAYLVNVIAHLARGAAVLPGLDRDIDRRSFDALEDSHPQSGLAALLRELGKSAREIVSWPGSGATAARAKLLSVTLRPAEATDDWLELVSELAADRSSLERGIEGLAILQTENEEAEATAIAIEFRRTLETKDETALLVTPDRGLARRVAIKMRRWDVIVDDSGGTSFGNSPCGTFLRLVAQWLDDPENPISLLAMLRDPRTGLRLDAQRRANAIDHIDRALRGARRPNPLQKIQESLEEGDIHAADVSIAAGLLLRISETLEKERGAGFAELLGAHIEIAETLCADNEHEGAERLWSGEDGAAGSQFLSSLQQSLHTIANIDAENYSDLFDALIASQIVRNRRDAHPRLRILGPLEARLQSADHIILGGLNEGMWPADAQEGAFLSRTMRRQAGLPSPEKKIGLSAHDFSQIAAQKRVTLTRAKRSGGAPTKPSRWLVRLNNILNGAGVTALVDNTEQVNALIGQFDRPVAVTPVERPRVRIPGDLRPTRLPVTAIETWLRDPYAIYAKYVLGLRKLDSPGGDFGQREIGSLLHDVFLQAAKLETVASLDTLRVMLNNACANYGMSPIDQFFWRRAIDSSLAWFQSFDAERRKEGVAAILEETGQATLNEISPAFTLTARADRIDLLTTGEAAIFDYKSGVIPSEKQGDTFNPQLALTGVIVNAGGYEAIKNAKVHQYAYIKVLNRTADSKRNGWGREGEDAAKAIIEARENVLRLVSAFNNPNSAYHSQPRPEFLNRFGDYDQLARRKEWTNGSDEGDTDA